MSAILFDMYGVIAKVQTPESRDRIVAIAHQPEEAFWEAFWGQRHDYDAGRIDGAEYWGRVAEQLGTPFDAAQVAALIEADIDSWSRVDDSMVEYVKGLAASGTRLGLLSNIPPEHAGRYGSREWLSVFDSVGFSCDIGHAKPEAEAFEWSSRQLGVPLEQILFIDDAPVNIEAAAELGLATHLFTSQAELTPVVAAFP